MPTLHNTYLYDHNTTRSSYQPKSKSDLASGAAAAAPGALTPGSSSLVHALLRSVVLRLATNNLHHDCLDAYRNVRG